MKRTILAAAAAAACAWGAMAIPAKPGMKTSVTGPDGNAVAVTLRGDEHFRYYQTADGRYLAADGQGGYAYVDDAALRQRAAKAAGRRVASRASAADQNESQVPHVGSPRVPVILVSYQDVDFRDGDGANAAFNEFFNTGDKSALRYFTDNSNGLFTPRFDIYGPYKLSNKRSYYGGNVYNAYYDENEDVRPGTMVGEGCAGLDPQIDFSLYDNNGDGECDVVIVLYAGVGEASSDVEEAVWPMQWQLDESDYGKALRLDGVTVNKFAVFNELNGSATSKLDGVGTFCHEFSHCLGLPDFYDTTYGGNFGMGPWSLMDYGSYNDDGYTPIGYSAYEKWFMGWIDDIPEPTPGSKVTLPVFNQKNLATDVAYRLVNPANANEYYVLENRARQGWDQYIDAQGLMIYHVTYVASRWYYNSVNDYGEPYECMAIVAADNKRADSSCSGDLYPYGSNNSFTSTSSPAARLNLGGSVLDKPVTEITRDAATGNVTFRYMAGALPAVPAPDFAGSLPTDEDMLPSATGFTAKWPASAAEVPVTYTLELRPHSFAKTELLLSETFETSTTWTEVPYTGFEDGAIRMGSNKNTGGVVSPAFTLDDDLGLTVFVNAKYYGTDGSSLKVAVTSASGSEIASQTVALTASYDTYAVKFPSVKAGSYKVSVSTVANKKRAYLAWAKVFSGDADSAEAAPSRSALDNPDYENPATETRQITGVTATEYRVEGLTAGGVYDWRVRAVPVDEETASASAWTEYVPVELPLTSGVEAVDAGTDLPAEYFDLMGRRVERPAKGGFYLRRQGGKVTKVAL